MKLRNCISILVLSLLSASCSHGTDANEDRLDAQNDETIIPIASEIIGLWEYRGDNDPNTSYINITDEEISAYYFTETPWGIEGSCYETASAPLTRIDQTRYKEVNTPYEFEFTLDGNELQQDQIYVSEAYIECIYDEINGDVPTKFYEKVENIDANDFQLCKTLRQEQSVNPSDQPNSGFYSCEHPTVINVFDNTGRYY